MGLTTLVTGGFGFVGRTTVQKLIEDGERVICLDRRFTDDEAEQDLYKYYQADISDIGRMVDILRNEKVDRVIHTAAISHPVVSREIPYQTVMTNAVGTTAVFEAARITGVRRVVNFSSECAYGNQAPGPIFETAPLQPTTPYGVTKVFTEHLARVYTNLYGMEIPSLRPGWVYGPGQFMQCYLKTMLRNAIDGIATYEAVGGDYRFQYVHVEDVAQLAILAAVTPDIGCEVFNATAGVQFSYQEVVQAVKAQFPEAVVEVGPGTIDILDQNGTFSIEKAQSQLGYRPRYHLAAGIAEYSEWLRKNPF